MDLRDFVRRFYELRKTIRAGAAPEITRSEMMLLADRAYEISGELGREHLHSEEFIFNRGCQPDDPRFYRHLHAIEDVVNHLGGALRAREEGGEEIPSAE